MGWNPAVYRMKCMFYIHGKNVKPRGDTKFNLKKFDFDFSERDRFLPTAAGVHLSNINAATLAAQQGGLAGSASDYMRLAMPVRDPDNGDAISGSGIFKLSLPT